MPKKEKITKKEIIGTLTINSLYDDNGSMSIGDELRIKIEGEKTPRLDNSSNIIDLIPYELREVKVKITIEKYN